MRAGILYGPKDLRAGDWPEPEPGEGEVLVEAACASVCGTDHHIWLGEFEGRVACPAVLGHEFTGRVAETRRWPDGARGPPAWWPICWGSPTSAR